MSFVAGCLLLLYEMRLDAGGIRWFWAEEQRSDVPGRGIADV
jgi:hypothetical protein